MHKDLLKHTVLSVQPVLSNVMMDKTDALNLDMLSGYNQDNSAQLASAATGMLAEPGSVYHFHH